MNDGTPGSRLERLFRKLLDSGASRRDEILHDLERDEPELAETLRRMLRAADRSRLDAGGPTSSAGHDVRPPVAGDTFGRFVLERPLGQGGMGTVWLAYDRDLDRRLALKLLNPQLLGQESARIRFRREARALAALRHDGIATVHEVGEHGGHDYLAMEWIDGVPLDRFVRERGPSLGLVLALALQIAEALEACHAAGVIHRDLKPSNVLVTPDGRVKIVDFGLAKGVERPGSGDSVLETLTRTAVLTEDGALLGTPDHMSPEQALARPVDPRSDLFAFGITLYELFSGVNPFRREGVVATLAAIVKEPAPDLTRTAKVPREVAALVHACLAKKPEDRPRDAAEVARRLRVLTASRSRLVQRWSLRARAWVAAVRWRRVAVAVAGIAVVVATIDVTRRLGVHDVYRAVAVLPMEHLGDPAEGTEEYGMGLSRTLTTKLSKMDRIRVVPWSEVRRIDPANTDVADLLRRLDVDAILFGRYEVRGSRITIVTELVDGRTGLQIGSREFGRPVDEFALLQNEVALETVRQLTGELTASDRVKLLEGATAEVEAFELYLRGLDQLRNAEPGSDLEARTLLQNALTLDPDLIEAHEALGIVLSLGYFSEIYPEEALDRAIEHLRWVLDRDPARVPALRGLIRALWNRGDSTGILRLLEDGLPEAIDPVDRWLVIGDGLLFSGLESDALRAYREALAIDPTHESALWQGVVAAAWARDLATTRTLSEAYFDAYGRDAEILLWRAAREWMDGDRDLALDIGREIHRLTRDTFVRPGILTGVAELLQLTGHPDEADELLLDVIYDGERRLETHGPNARGMLSVAAAYAQIGDLEGVDAYLARAEAVTDSPYLLGDEAGTVEAVAGRYGRFVERVNRAMDAGYVPTGFFAEAVWLEPEALASEAAQEAIRRRQSMAGARRTRLVRSGVIPDSWSRPEARDDGTF